jgi:CheY-like chemotaxis protein
MTDQARVLVAEDDPEMLDVVAAAAEEHGAEVVRAHSGADLIQILADQGPFDLIITDISMPWMSGLQVARAARSAGLNTPVIVMTALKNDDLARQVRQLGEPAVLLHKPFELTDLHAAMSTMLSVATAPVVTP